MAICIHCKTEITISPASGNYCPVCGREMEFGSSELLEDTSHEQELREDRTLAFTPSGDEPSQQDEKSEPDVDLDFTHVFGGKFEGEDDLGDDGGFDEIALDEASSPDVTQPLGGSSAGSAGPRPKSGDTVRRPSDSTSPDATQMIGADAGDSGQSDWPTGVTMPVGLSGSDRAESGSPDTHREAETIMHDSGTLKMGSGRRSSDVHTPKSREITGLSSGRTVPRGPLGEGGASRSLKAGDVQLVGPEQIRLRAFGLNEGSELEETDFLLRGSAGKGGMGIVYRAQQRSLDRDVAVKQMKSDLADSESDRNKFLTEAVITGQLEHPNIIPVHELGLAADGLPFYAMKFVIGDDWEDRIKKLSEQENLNILIQVSNAIAFAHSRNVIHRDLKPGNVRLGNFGEVLVMDWGLAARLDKDGEIPPAGTPLYMAPETALEYLDHVNQQSTGGSRSSTRRIKAGTYSDVYLLGALLFKIVTGKAPHSGKTPFECLRNAARNRIVKVDRSSELLDIAYKAMATNPADRYRSVPEFVSALKSYQAHAQSIQIARRASEDLADAEEQKSAPGVSSAATYAIYSSAQHGFQNALDLWTENRKAKEQLTKCKQSFADTAYSNGDYDLALSLLDGDEDADSELVSNIRRSQRQRQTRLAWFTTLRYATAASLMLALVFIAYSFYARSDAIYQTRLAAAARQDADEQSALAETKSLEAKEQEALAQKMTQEAERATALATQKSGEAERAVAAAATAAQEAKQALDESETAKREALVAKQEAQREKYLAAVSAVNAVLLESGEYAASKKMEALEPEVIPDDGQEVPIEWANLQRRTDWTQEAQELKAIQLNQPRVAASPDGTWLVAIGSGADDSQLLLFNTNDLEVPIHKSDLKAPAIRATVSPDGKLVAVLTGEGAGGRLIVVDTQTGKTFRPGEVAEDSSSISTVAFAPSGDKLVTGDGSTGLAEWQMDFGTGTIRQIAAEDRVHGHPLVAVGYSADGNHIFSADQSGEIRVWKRNESNRWRPVWSYLHSEVASGKPQITAATCSSQADDGLAIGYGCADGAVYLLQIPAAAIRQPSTDPLAWSEMTPEKMSHGHLGSITDLSFAKRGAVMISSGYDTLQIHDLDRNRLDDRQGGREIEPTRRYHDTTVLSCAAGQDEFAYSSDEIGRVLKWKIDVPPKTVVFDSPSDRAGTITLLEVSPDNPPRIAVTDNAGFTEVWSAGDERKLLDHLFLGHDEHRRMQAWYVPGSKGKIVTVAPVDESRVSEDRESGYRACLWDAETGSLKRSRDIGPRSVLTVSADGNSLLAATDRNGVEAQSFDLSDLESKPMWENYPRISAMLSINMPGESQPTTVVGLRDGQVYLWHPERGRIELERSSRRTHWKPIRDFAYDATANVLYTADSDGLVSRRQLGAASAHGAAARHLNPNRTEAVTRLELSSDGSLLLAIVNLGGSTELRLLDPKELTPVANQPAQLNHVIDAAFSPVGDSILALAEGSSIREWFVGEAAWQRPKWATEVKSALRGGESITGLRVDPRGNLLFYGPGFAQLWTGAPADPILASVVRSRPRTHLVSFQSGKPDHLTALSGDGRLNDWTRTEDRPFALEEKALSGLRDIVRACPAGEEGHAFLALRDSTSGLTRIEKWNLNAGELISNVAEPFEGTCDVLTAKAGRVVIASRHEGQSTVSIFDATGAHPAERVGLDAESRVTFIDLAQAGDRLLVCTNSGQAFLVTREPNGEWTPLPFDRNDYSAAIFSPGGDRLILGSATGHVFIALPQMAEDQWTARLLLSLPGHSERITVLKFAERDNKLTLLSGDAAGRVLMHPLQ